MFYPRTGVSFLLILAFIIPLFGISACRSGPQQSENAPAILLQKSKQEDKNKDYFQAELYVKQVLEDYPDSQERVEALMLRADIQMKKTDYFEAESNYQKFIELYPAWPNVDHAYFYLAMADFMRIDLASRDQTYTRKALAKFGQLIKTFPKSSYRKRTDAKILACQKKLAENILEIGRYYFRTHSYQSAITRLKNLLNTYPNQKFNDEAIFLLAESYFNEQNYREAQLFYNQLLDQYPRSSFIREARLRLKVLR